MQMSGEKGPGRVPRTCLVHGNTLTRIKIKEGNEKGESRFGVQETGGHMEYEGLATDTTHMALERPGEDTEPGAANTYRGEGGRGVRNEAGEKS